MMPLGPHEVREFSRVRRILSDFNTVACQQPRMIGLIEVDVTKGLGNIQQYQDETGFKLSFTGWIIKCIAQAVEENRMVHAFRKGKNKIIVPENVDIGVMIEGDAGDKKVPINHVIKDSNLKSLTAITEEIREIQAHKMKEDQSLVEGGRKYLKIYPLIPGFFRRLYIKKLINNPEYITSRAGTVGVTAVGMFGHGTGWAIPFGVRTLDIGLGGMTKKPGVVDDRIQVREYLQMTLLVDHNIVDGAPAARFAGRLMELIESGFGFSI